MEPQVDRRHKNRLTFWHQIATLVLLPILGWIGLQFVDIRDSAKKSAEALARIENTLPQAWARINDHEARLRVVEAQRLRDMEWPR